MYMYVAINNVLATSYKLRLFGFCNKKKSILATIVSDDTIVANGIVLASTKYRCRKSNSNGVDATTVSSDIVAANNISDDF
jgi:hypothetical protein